MSERRVGSLFSGIGGLDLALEYHGFEVAFQVENDAYCNKVLEKHWPEVTRYGDIRTVDYAECGPVEGLIGGFPCQPFSVAGANRGQDDERNMWPEVIRAVRALRPGFVFLENVPGLLTHRYFGTILGDLAEAGYHAEWGTFRASDVGASHRRERLFILAYTSGGFIPESKRGSQTRDGIAADGEGDVAHARHGLSPRDTGRGDRRLPDADGDAQETPGRRQNIEPRSTRAGDVLAYAGYGRWPGQECQHDSVGRVQELGQAGNSADARPVAYSEGISQREPHDSQRTESRGNSRGNLSGDSRQLVNTVSGSIKDRGRNNPTQSEHARSSHRSSTAFPPGPSDIDGWARVLSEMPALEPAVCNLATSFPNRLARLKALGNAVVWPQAALAFDELRRRIR